MFIDLLSARYNEHPVVDRRLLWLCAERSIIESHTHTHTRPDTPTVNSELASIQESFYPGLCKNDMVVRFGVVWLMDGASGCKLLMTGSW